MQTILIIDDEHDIRDLLGDIFEDEGFEVLKAAHSEQALSLISRNNVDLIVLDIWLDNSDMDGIQILKHLKAQDNYRQIPVLMISGHGNVEMAVNAMKVGAFDFIEKPFKIDHILLTVQRALEQKSLQEQNIRLKETVDITPVKHQYKSQAMLSLMKLVNDHAESEARVLISGGIGAGKTRLAKIIHEASKRGRNPLRFLHATILTPDDLDAELHHNSKGTTVIEGIDVLGREKQADFLAYLNKPSSNVGRIICTSTDRIDQLVKEQKFSSALYDRVAVQRYDVPDLKDRREDLPILINEFVSLYQNEFGVTIVNDFLPVEELKDFVWSGNVKQLKSAVEWMTFCQMGRDCHASPLYDVPLRRRNDPDTKIVSYPVGRTGRHSEIGQMYEMSLKEARDKFESEYLLHMLEKFEGNIARMATYIDMDRTALHRKLKSMNITFESKVKAESI